MCVGSRLQRSLVIEDRLEHFRHLGAHDLTRTLKPHSELDGPQFRDAEEGQSGDAVSMAKVKSPLVAIESPHLGVVLENRLL